MKSDKPQKFIIPYIIEVLKEYTDEEHTLNQKRIGEILESQYELIINRKTLSRNLRDAMIFDENIHCKRKRRDNVEVTEFDDDEGVIYTDFYYEHLFENSELQVLFYNIIFSKHIEAHHKKDLLEKLESLGSLSVKRDIRHYIIENVSYSDCISYCMGLLSKRILN